jgi:uncharacterized protein YndB with AHSA1/START domain
MVKITVETKIAAPIEDVWRAWTTPDDIKQWNAASDDWHTTKAEVDLRVGGTFSSRMEAKDGSMGFDFAGTYTRIVDQELIECSFGDRVLLVELCPARRVSPSARLLMQSQRIPSTNSARVDSQS